ncbi:MAG: hypothetical protein HYT89_00275, partial [Candidatus Omnitrophica bacterium]|nr:hypothetical protein [Candidatus Omnitrophota bacterium]
MRLLRPHAYFIFFYGLIFILFLWPLISLQKTFIGGDYWVQFYPWSRFFADSLKAGNWPYWTDRIGLGFPLIAEGQVAGYYPPNILSFIGLPFH